MAAIVIFTGTQVQTEPRGRTFALDQSPSHRLSLPASADCGCFECVQKLCTSMQAFDDHYRKAQSKSTICAGQSTTQCFEEAVLCHFQHLGPWWRWWPWGDRLPLRSSLHSLIIFQLNSARQWTCGMHAYVVLALRYRHIDFIHPGMRIVQSVLKWLQGCTFLPANQIHTIIAEAFEVQPRQVQSERESQA